jgi:hydrophobe/amphiphile efflux-1 (HAE1) family protein
MKRRFRTGGLAAWSIYRPIAVTMLSLTVVVLGLFSFDKLNIDLLPKIIYPDIRISVADPGVPARIMEDNITRQLEEQLAITEGATVVQSRTSEGRSAISLSFPYGTDIDIALREASTRLDRAKRFLPDSIEPPTIYKRDPAQIPILELIVSSAQRDSVELRSWTDYEFSKWFLNIKGVASTEVGGGLVREIQILIDQEKLAAAGFKFIDVINILQKENLDIASGTLYMQNRKLSTRIHGRFKSIEEIAQLPLIKTASQRIDESIRLGDIAQIIYTHESEKLRIRLNGRAGIKLSIQKQPQANTVDVVNAVVEKLQWFKQQNLLPDDIFIEKVADQSTYVRYSLRNAAMAALSGALLAMLVVYLFLGDLRRTLIISTAIPLAILITLTIMGISGLTLNIMSLGGLALGVGLLVDNTIVMLENISRHQSNSNNKQQSAIDAAAEVTSAITASTATNLAAVLPFLFIGGLIGLLFSELIITLSAAIIASLLVALTLVPALGAKIYKTEQNKHSGFEKIFLILQNYYHKILPKVLRNTRYIFIVSLPLLGCAIYAMHSSKDIFFPAMDEGRISIGITGEPGIRLEEMDAALSQVEQLLLQQVDVQSVFVTAGGFVFGRSSFQRSNRGSLSVQLKPSQQRNIGVKAWVKKMRKEIKDLGLIGYRVSLRVRGVRGVHLGRGDDDISVRLQGNDIDTLSTAADKIIEAIKDIPDISNLQHNYQQTIEELVLKVDRERAADLGIHISDIGRAMNIALSGLIVSDYLDGDRQYNIRLRMHSGAFQSINDIQNTIINIHQQKIIRIRDVAKIEILPTPSSIKRDNQRRIVEISASLAGNAVLSEVMHDIFTRIDEINLPTGYSVYDGGALDTLRKDKTTGYILLLLALFLVFVVMAVQYESWINPIIIMLGVPFTLIGVALGVYFLLDHQLSMPARIGIIMLAGIVVNNAIVLIEQIEIQREKGQLIIDAITEAARLRLRPILMTTLTTVMGMLPLAIGLGEGSEMLEPMATVIVLGLSVSMLISLFMIPAMYHLLHKETAS